MGYFNECESVATQGGADDYCPQTDAAGIVNRLKTFRISREYSILIFTLYMTNGFKWLFDVNKLKIMKRCRWIKELI